MTEERPSTAASSVTTVDPGTGGSEATDRTAAAVVAPADAPGTGADADAPPADPEATDERRLPLTRTQRRWLVAIVASAAVVRLAWLAYANVEPPVWYLPSGDSFSYWYYGNEIADGRGYISYMTGEATAYYPIGFPALLAALYWLAERVPFVDLDLMLVTGVFQVIISAATAALTFVVGRRLLGPRAGLVAAAVIALFPNLVYQVTTIQVETTFVFLTMAALAVAVDHDWATGPPSTARLLAFGALLSASALTRPFSAPLLLGLFLAVVHLGAGWRRALLSVGVPVAVLVVAFTPWTIRNAIQLDTFAPSSTNMGDTLCIDRGPGTDGGFQWATHSGCADPELGEAERNRESTRLAIRYVIDDPGRELVHIAKRAQLMFAEDHDGIIATEGLGSGPILSDTVRDLTTTAADWYFYAVLAASVLGLPVLVRRGASAELRLVLAGIVTLLAIPLLLWGNPRFHQPLVPFMALSLAALATVAVERLRA